MQHATDQEHLNVASRDQRPPEAPTGVGALAWASASTA
jgi:hypothetical protein